MPSACALSNQAAVELKQPAALLNFQKWLEAKDCYVFTINGFSLRQISRHPREGAGFTCRIGLRLKRVAYTNLLFDLLVELLPKESEGSVSTVPCGF